MKNVVIVLFLAIFMGGCIEEELENNLESIENQAVQTIQTVQTVFKDQILLKNPKYQNLPNMTYEEAIQKYGYSRVLIVGKNMSYWIECTGSMEPVINCNDRYIGLRPYNRFDFVVGDIVFFTTPKNRCIIINVTENQRSEICFYSDNEFTLHRIVRISIITNTSMFVITKGDAVSEEDPVAVDTTTIKFKIIARLPG